MRRWGLPIVAILLLVGIGLVSRQLGYLGRVDGGPLTAAGLAKGIAIGSGGRAPRRVLVFRGPLRIDGGPVRVTASRPIRVSPGLQVLGPRVDRGSGGGAKVVRRWPAARTDIGPFVGARVKDRVRDGVALGLRARRPGTYYVFGLRTDYERGARQFRHESDGLLCLGVRRPCNLGTKLPEADRPLVDLGGPSDYGVRLRAGAGGDGRDVARYPAKAGRRTVEVTLTNQSADPISVRDLSLGISSSGFDVRLQATPARFTLASGRARGVQLDLRLTGCARGGTGASVSTDELQAQIDGDPARVPLLTTLEFAAPASC